jgi:intein-encoded DNA endonuclease-like protein
MRLILKTMEKVVIEVHTKEVENDGFEFLWDKIRDVYKMDKYEIFNIEEDKDKTLIYIELVPSKQKELQFSCNSF